MKKIFVYLPAVLTAIFCISCSAHNTESVKDTNAISDSIVKNIQVTPVLSEDQEGFIKLNGKIQPNESKQVKVFALVSGRIHSVDVELGDYVKKGQLLAVLKSTEVAGITNDLSMAKAGVALAKKNLETTKDLYDGNLATEQDYLNAKIARDKSLSELARSRQVASITGGTNSNYLVTAPISGFIIEKNITNSSQIRPDNNAPLFSIADLSSVWIMANVYEADMSNIHAGDAVQVTTLAKPDKDYVGKIDKIYNVLDPTTRTMKVRISMDNPDNELKPEMFASVKVNGTTSGKQLTIPSGCVVMDNSKNYVVIRKSNKLEVHEITLIKRVDSKAYVSGLSIGDEVVTNSQVFLYQALVTN